MQANSYIVDKIENQILEGNIVLRYFISTTGMLVWLDCYKLFIFEASMML